MFRYAVTIFLSAFLLFQVQPLIGKFILPWFGGTPAVWTTCMLFFQAALLAGYSYAHFITSKVSPRGQMFTHLGLLIASLVFLPIAPNADIWKPQGDEMPIGRILALLTASIGLPYFMLSTTGPLLQESFRRETGKPPYRLYSLSNVGSLLALLSYPFVFEPEFTLKIQIWGWSVAYCVFAVFCGWCALGFIKPAHHAEFVDTTAGAPVAPAYAGPPTGRDIGLWLALAACGSAMLLATTNLLCQEVCSVPFLWVLPLALYLTTFIICFDHERWYHRNVFLGLLVIAVVGACWAINEGTRLQLWKQLTIFGGTMWVCCMICHGELVRSKPAARHATLFYLMVSAGGVIGGLLVAVVAPLLLNGYWEFHMSIVATILLAFFATARSEPMMKADPTTRRVVISMMMVGLGVVLAWFARARWADMDSTETVLESTRNFYGVLHIKREDDPEDERGPTKELVHGRIQHGFQFEDPKRSGWATTYYGPPSGVGLAIEQHPQRARGPMKIGVVGLGCGTLAVYGRKGDSITFYEINPEVLRISEQYFTYRKDSLADLNIVLGDARIKMERELEDNKSQRFDVLAIDAFSSDAIPMHLLTLECARLFRDELKPDGILCMHISNRFLDLKPVVRGLADELGLECVLIDSEHDSDLGLNHAAWAILTKNKEFLDLPAIQDAITPWENDLKILWTDDYASLWQTLNADQKSVNVGGD